MRIADLLREEVRDAQAPAPPTAPEGQEGPLPQAPLDPIGSIVAERPFPPAEEERPTSLPPPRRSSWIFPVLAAGAGLLLLMALWPRPKAQAKEANQAGREVSEGEAASLEAEPMEEYGYGELQDLYERVYRPFLWT